MITVVYCTRETKPEHKEHLIKSSGLHKHIEVIEIINNGESLTKAYNRGLKQAKNDIVVFCHDDLTIETKQWGNKMLKQFEKNPEYGIIGVAGSKNMPVSGQWWEDRKKMYGRVAHTHDGKTWLSSYSEDQGRELEEVVVVDGVFFAVDKTKIKANFNENVEGFHFYEITFCFENYLKDVKLGVSTLIRINHQSIGETNESWENNRRDFSEIFQANLPVDIRKTFNKNKKIKVLVGCINLKGESTDEKYVLELVKRLKEEGSDVSVVSNIDPKIALKLKNLGVKSFSLQEPPGFKLGDGKWKLKTVNGDIDSELNTLYKLSDTSFDVLHLNQSPVVNHLLRLYPDTETICTIHSNDKSKDEPIINPQIKKYIAINDEVKESLTNNYGIDTNMVILNSIDEIIEEYNLMLA